MALALRRPADASRIDAAFRALVGSPQDEIAAGLLGLEHEYRLWRAGRRLDFRSLIHQLPIRGRRIDVADPNAYRCDWGGLLTCDGAEAEVATPPIAQRPSFTQAVHEAGLAGRRDLEAVLPAGIELEGYSTHLSASIPAALNDAAAVLYAQVFAPALMVLMDRSDSPGLLIRPRPGRLELCGEFSSGPPLRALTAFVAGSVRACAAALSARRETSVRLPPAVRVELAPARERFGWFVDRAAFGPDLYATGRTALLTRPDGGSITAQEHLEAAYEVVRSALVGSASQDDLRDLEAMVTRRLPLPSERSAPAIDPLPSAVPSPERLADRSAWARALGTVQRPTFSVNGERLSWDFAVFRVAGRGRSAYASVPRASLDRFLTLLAVGRLDQLMERFLLLADQGATLEHHSMTMSPGLFGAIGAAGSLAAPERLPLGALGGPWERPGKRREEDDAGDQDQAEKTDQAARQQAQNAATPAGPFATPPVFSASSAFTSVARRGAAPRPLIYAAAGAIAAVALVAALAAAGLIPGIGPSAPADPSASGPGLGLASPSSMVSASPSNPIPVPTSTSLQPAFVEAQTIPCDEIVAREELLATFAYTYSGIDHGVVDSIEEAPGQSICSFAVSWQEGNAKGAFLLLVRVVTGISDDYWEREGTLPVPQVHDAAYSITQPDGETLSRWPRSIYHLLVPIRPGLGIHIRVPVPKPGQPANPEEGAAAVALLVMERLDDRFGASSVPSIAPFEQP